MEHALSLSNTTFDAIAQCGAVHSLRAIASVHVACLLTLLLPVASCCCCAGATLLTALIAATFTACQRMSQKCSRAMLQIQMQIEVEVEIEIELANAITIGNLDLQLQLAYRKSTAK